MKKIWKYDLAPYTKLRVPEGAKFLCIQSQRDKPRAWFLVNPDAPQVEEVFFYTYGTGHEIPDDCGEYVETYQVAKGALVFHVFKV